MSLPEDIAQTVGQHSGQYGVLESEQGKMDLAAILNPKPSTLNPKPQTPNPKPSPKQPGVPRMDAAVPRQMHAGLRG